MTIILQCHHPSMKSVQQYGYHRAAHLPHSSLRFSSADSSLQYSSGSSLHYGAGSSLHHSSDASPALAARAASCGAMLKSSPFVNIFPLSKVPKEISPSWGLRIASGEHGYIVTSTRPWKNRRSVQMIMLSCCECRVAPEFA